jgi:hypothetical protein
MHFRNILIISSLLFSASVFADKGKDNDRDKIKSIIQKHKPNLDCIFDVIPLNSPVKESVARFLIKTPDRFEIDEVTYQVKNSGRIFEKPKAHQKINLVVGPEGSELRINVSKLPPGFYQLLVKIKDRSRKEHNFKTKFKDHAMFVIDQTLEVPMPDPKKNDATLLGIDSDNDGIRDDVQRWINENLSNKPIELKLAYKQYAVAFQSSLPISNDKNASIFASHTNLKAQGCLYGVGELLLVQPKELIEIRTKIKLMFLNTKERIEASLKASENFHGQEVSILSREESCNF